MQGNSDLAGSEVRTEVAADISDHLDDVRPHFGRELLQLIFGEAVQVSRPFDTCEEGSDGRVFGGGHLSLSWM
jgi:hypothetical protein